MSHPQRAGTVTQCNDFIDKGIGLSVYDRVGDSCTRILKRKHSIHSPSIPIQLTDKLLELRDGSVNNPIVLPALQKSKESGVPSIVGILADGTLVAWHASNFANKSKIVIRDGLFTVVDDVSSDLFDSALCEETCDLVEGAIGYKRIISRCKGKPDKVRYQLFRIPVDCSDGGVIDEDDCSLTLVEYPPYQ